MDEGEVAVWGGTWFWGDISMGGSGCVDTLLPVELVGTVAVVGESFSLVGEMMFGLGTVAFDGEYGLVVWFQCVGDGDCITS